MIQIKVQIIKAFGHEEGYFKHQMDQGKDFKISISYKKNAVIKLLPSKPKEMSIMRSFSADDLYRKLEVSFDPFLN